MDSSIDRLPKDLFRSVVFDVPGNNVAKFFFSDEDGFPRRRQSSVPFPKKDISFKKHMHHYTNKFY